jgi:NADPH:quinone reductase-like Zn-dependent oxidoreductase
VMTARQWIAAGFGGPEVLRLREAGVPPPGPGEVTIEVRACGMNPADYKHFAPGQDKSLLPLTLGYETAGVITDISPDTSIATGGGSIGDEGFAAIGAGNPASGPFRAGARASIVGLAASGDLTVPLARTFAFEDARDAVAMLAGPHPSGKLALVLNP